MAELVLVTGGSGYIAGWCIAELLRRGYDVRTTVRDSSREKAVVDAVSTVADPAGRLSFAVADLTADDGWDVAVKGADRVLHVASPLGLGSAGPDAIVHIRAMTSPDAAGQRFLATGEFMWMAEMARVLREGLGADGRKVSTRQIPDVAVRFAARFLDPSLREITPALGRRNRHSTEKAGRILGWQPRPARETVLDCARSLIAHGVV
jgi:nucleoside-diphosphate-sugar epimerase